MDIRTPFVVVGVCLALCAALPAFSQEAVPPAGDSPRFAWEAARARIGVRDWAGVWDLLSQEAQEDFMLEMIRERKRWRKFDEERRERMTGKTYGELLAMQEAVGQVRVEDDLVGYITDLVSRTRNHASIQLGASPRGSVGLLAVARVRAATEGRDFVTPDDVKGLAPAVLRHRLMLHPDAELEGVTPDDCIAAVLRETPVPKSAAA